MEETRGTQKVGSHHEKREYVRYNVAHYPVELKKTDGTKLRALLNDVSFGGFQILCTDLTAHILSQKTGLLTEDEGQDAEISINIPFKEGIEKIMANCKLAYTAKNEDAEGGSTFAIGLQVNNFKGKSVQTINRLILGQAIVGA